MTKKKGLIIIDKDTIIDLEEFDKAMKEAAKRPIIIKGGKTTFTKIEEIKPNSK